MQLKSLELRKQEWGDNIGRYTGQVIFANTLGEIKLSLNPSFSERILAVVQEQIVESAREVAQELSVQALQPLSLPQPAPKVPDDDFPF